MKTNKYMKVLSMAGVVVLSLGTLIGCGAKQPADEQNAQADATKTQEIVMGTNAEFEPFEYRGNGGEVVGFDVEIAKKIAEKVGKSLKVEDMAFDTLIVGLNNDQMDFIAAGMSVTDERKKQVDFSDPYFKSKQMIIVKKDNDTIKTADDLEGKKIGVQLGTTGDLFVSSYLKNKEVVQFDKAALAVMDLKNGQVDAVVVDAEPAKKLVQGQDDLKILDAPFVEEEYAIAVKKGNKELLDAINEVIAEIKASGEYDTIHKQFFAE